MGRCLTLRGAALLLLSNACHVAHPDADSTGRAQLRVLTYNVLYVFDHGQEVEAGSAWTQAVLNHTNTRLPFRWMEPLLVSPRIHHWHHSNQREAYDKNLAVHFPWIDRLFGTYHAPGDQWPEAVDPEGVSFPKGYWAQLVYPFRRDPKTAEPMGDPSSH